MVKRMALWLMCGMVGVGVLMGACTWALFWWNARPVIAVDYVAKLNEMRKPADYRLEDDGWDLFVRACAIAPRGMPFVCTPTNSPADMNDAQRARIRAWVASGEDAIVCLEEAMQRRYYWPRWTSPDGSLRYLRTYGEVDPSRVAGALLWRGKMKAYDGNLRGGLADVIASGRVGACYGEMPTRQEWIGGSFDAMMCAFAVADMVRNGALTNEELESLARDVERTTGRWEDMDAQMAILKLQFLDEIQRRFTDDGHGDGRIIPAQVAKMWWHDCCDRSWLQNFRMVSYISTHHPGRKATTECFDRVLTIFRQRWQYAGPRKRGDQETAWIAADSEIHAVTGDNLMVEECISSLRIEDSDELQKVRNYAEKALATIAVARFKAQTGRLPDGWEDIVAKGYLAERPVDWFSGREFVYEKMGDTFIVYISEGEKEWMEKHKSQLSKADD